MCCGVPALLKNSGFCFFVSFVFLSNVSVFFSVSDCFDCMYTTCMVPMEVRRGHLIYLGTGVRDGSEPQC